MSSGPAGEDRSSASKRFAKYFVLMVLMVADLTLILFTFSSYVERRHFDDLLKQANNGSTYESLHYAMAQYKSAAKDILNARCAQRDAIAFYRLSTLHLYANLNKAYQLSLDVRSALYDFVEKHKDVLDVRGTRAAIDAAWGPWIFPEKFAFNELATDESKKNLREEYGKLQMNLLAHADEVVSNDQELHQFLDTEGAKIGLQPASTFKDLVNQRQAMIDLGDYVFNLSAIDALERRVKDLQPIINGLKADPIFMAFVQRRVAEESAEESLSLEEAAARLNEALNPSRGAADGSLVDLPCDNIDRPMLKALQVFFDKNVKPGLKYHLAQRLEGGFAPKKAFGGTTADMKDFLGKATAEAVDGAWGSTSGTWNGKTAEAAMFGAAVREPVATAGTSWYQYPNRAVAHFGTWPTSIQTLFVTMFFGVAGALCMNGLRLSKHGYWANLEEPHWGEIWFSVILGAFAALVVFLLATLGLILVSDGQARSGEFSSVGASLVGLLAFVSGLLNDAAFARIKQFGESVFGASAERSAQEDGEVRESLARLAIAAGSSRFAALALVHGLEQELASKAPGFTLFVPADSAFDGMSAEAWDALTSTSKLAFEALRKRLVTEAPLKPDQLRAMKTVKMEDGTEMVVTLLPNAKLLKLGGLTVHLDARLDWHGAPVYIVEELPVVG